MNKKYLVPAVFTLAGLILGSAGVKLYDLKHPKVEIKEVNKLETKNNDNKFIQPHSEKEWLKQIEEAKDENGIVDLNKLVNPLAITDPLLYKDSRDTFEAIIDKNWDIKETTNGIQFITKTPINDPYYICSGSKNPVLVVEWGSKDKYLKARNSTSTPNFVFKNNYSQFKTWYSPQITQADFVTDTLWYSINVLGTGQEVVESDVLQKPFIPCFYNFLASFKPLK